MNSWHSFSPNGRWLVFSSKSRSPYTQMFLTHVDEQGNDTPADPHRERHGGEPRGQHPGVREHPAGRAARDRRAGDGVLPADRRGLGRDERRASTLTAHPAARAGPGAEPGRPVRAQQLRVGACRDGTPAGGRSSSSGRRPRSARTTRTRTTTSRRRCVQSGRPDEAIAEFRKAVALKPDFARRTPGSAACWRSAGGSTRPSRTCRRPSSSAAEPRRPRQPLPGPLAGRPAARGHPARAGGGRALERPEPAAPRPARPPLRPGGTAPGGRRDGPPGDRRRDPGRRRAARRATCARASRPTRRPPAARPAAHAPDRRPGRGSVYLDRERDRARRPSRSRCGR